jgi:NDP-sugar pyrophosphorylase family protein
MCTALVMAGGRSERMRLTTGRIHKALVPVLGVPMIERNLLALLAQGFRNLVVAVNPQEREVIEYVRGRGANLAKLQGAALRCYEEEVSLGTIGAAGDLECRSEPLLVVNVDNLSTLNLNEFVQHHQHVAAALSIATHFEPFRIPFGEIVVRDGLITEYREKPTFSVHLSSGTYVLSERARSYIPKKCRTDVPGLFALLRERGERVVSFEHHAPWIDVNDAASLERAEQLIQQNIEEFEPLLPQDSNEG